MECLKNNRLQLIGLFFILIVGAVLHFTYEWSDNNFYVGLFSVVNESVWEHLKLGFFANLIFMIYEHIKIGNKKSYIPSKLIFSLVYILSVILIHYVLKALFGEIIFLDILNYIISVFIAQYLACIVLENDVSDNTYNHSKYILLILLILFVLFTIYPPFCDLFKDNEINTYGIFELERSLN